MVALWFSARASRDKFVRLEKPVLAFPPPAHAFVRKLSFFSKCRERNAQRSWLRNADRARKRIDPVLDNSSVGAQQTVPVARPKCGPYSDRSDIDARAARASMA